MRLHWLGEVQEAESPVRRLGGGGADHVDPANVYLILTHPDRRRLSPPDGHGHGAPISSPELPWLVGGGAESQLCSCRVLPLPWGDFHSTLHSEQVVKSQLRPQRKEHGQKQTCALDWRRADFRRPEDRQGIEGKSLPKGSGAACTHAKSQLISPPICLHP